MNILYIDHYAGSPSMGMEYRPYCLAREWTNMGHKVVIVAASYAHVRSVQPSEGCQEIDGISFMILPTPQYSGNGIGRILNMLYFIIGLRKWRQWLPFTPHVVIASSTYPMDIGPAKCIAKNTKAKLIWEVHDLWPLSPQELGGMSWWHPFILWVQHYEDLACRSSDAVVSLLPLAYKHLITRGMALRKFHYIPNGVDGDSDSCSEDIPIEIAQTIAQCRTEGRFILAYTGAHGTANSLDALVQCAVDANDRLFMVLMIGAGAEKNRLMQMAGSCPRIRFFDPVPKKFIQSILQKIDVAFISLQYRSLFQFGISPNKLMDYMLAGTPVMSAISAGNDPVRESSCGITIMPDSPSAILDAIEKFQKMSHDERLKMGRMGREYILKNQTYDVLANKFLDIMC